MVKKVRRTSGVVFNTALVVIGWVSFILGQVSTGLFVKCISLSIARVLPYDLSVSCGRASGET